MPSSSLHTRLIIHCFWYPYAYTDPLGAQDNSNTWIEMHSSFLRGTDFNLTYEGKQVPHAEYFSHFDSTERVGVISPDRFDAIGAGSLLMAYITAFYDRYREEGEEFFAYPDFFTFQMNDPIANYSMFDVWPFHKNVFLDGDQNERAAAITDRAVNILLVPEGRTSEPAIEPVGLESARRNIRRCFTYSTTGSVAAPELIVTCTKTELGDWVRKVLGSVDPPQSQDERSFWEDTLSKGGLPAQSFREISLEEALAAI